MLGSNQMKIVRIFLGGSVTLLQGDGEKKGYRLAVVDTLISSMNSRKSAKELYLVKTFADLEHEAKPGGQQRLFNHYLTKDADIALFIFEGEIGPHSSEELDLALDNRHKWGHPLIYIYGKDIEPGSLLIQQLKKREMYFEPFYDSADLQKKIRHDLENRPRFRHRLFPRQEKRDDGRRITLNTHKALAFLASVISLIVLYYTIQFVRFRESSYPVQRVIHPTKERGLIFDEQGQLLSVSTDYYNLYLDCTQINERLWDWDKDKFTYALATIDPSKSKKEYENIILRGIAEKKKHLRLCSRIESSQLKILSNASTIGASRRLIIDAVLSPIYPFGDVARRTIGYINENGLGCGLELSYHDILNGKDGYETVYYYRDGSINTLPDHSFIGLLLRREQVYFPPQDGQDLNTTLNISIQVIADSLLRAKTEPNLAINGACFLLMDVHDGAIKTIVNLVRDPNSGRMMENWNVSIAYLLNPGSLFDPVLYASLLINNSIEQKDNGVLSKVKKLSDYSHSQSVFLANLDSLKLSQSYPFDLEGWAPPHILDGSAISTQSGKMSYGILITPLHLLSFYNTIANNGIYHYPYLVDYHSKSNHFDYAVMDSTLSASVKTFIKSPVNPHGYKNDKYHLLGQSSLNVIPTDKKNKVEYQPSFVGFFPEESPEYSIACMVYTEPTSPSSKYKDIPISVVSEFLKIFQQDDNVGVKNPL